MANVNLDTNPLPTFGYDTSQPWDPSTAGSAPPLGQGGPPVRATYTPPPDTGKPLSPAPVTIGAGGQPVSVWSEEGNAASSNPMNPSSPNTANYPNYTAVSSGNPQCARSICPPDFNGWLCRFQNSIPGRKARPCPVQTNCLCWSDLLAYGGLFLVTLLGATLIVASRRGSGV